MSFIINEEVIEEVKDRSDIAEIISEYVDLKQSGKNLMGLCPFHKEKTPSFSVSEEGQFYNCFGCGAGGDSIEFIMEIENLEFIEAVKFLADKYGIVLEGRNVDTKLIEEKNRFYEMNRDAARFFYSNLQNNKRVINYLNNRGIPNRVINQFGLGYSLDSWEALYKHLLDKDYKEEEIEKNGLIVKRNSGTGYYDRFRNRVIFPIIDVRGRVIGFGGRVMDDSMPKYLNSRDSLIFNKGYNLYGLNLLAKHSNREKIILVEGYMDVIALFTAGINYSVASLGTSLTEEQGQLLKRYGKDVYIAYDSDEAGIRATLRSIDILLEEDVKPKIISLPDKMDPDDFIKEYGLAGFKKEMLKAENCIDYKIRIKKIGYDLDKTEDTINFTLEVAKIIESLKSPIEKDVYIKKIAQETGISSEAIKSEVQTLERKRSNNRRPLKRNRESIKFDKNKSKNSDSIDRDKIKNTGLMKAEQGLMKMILIDYEYFEIVKSNLDVSDLSAKYHNIFNIVEDIYLEEEKIDEERIKNEILKEEDKETLNLILGTDLIFEADDAINVLIDLIKTIKYNKLVKERDKILEEISRLEKGEIQIENNSKTLEELFEDLIDLNNKINSIRDE